MRRFSATDRLGKIRRPSGTRAMPSATRSWAATLASDRPSKRISPERTGNRPAIVFSSVDLPAPLAPMTAAVSAAPTVDRDVEQRLEVAVAGVDVVDLEQRHSSSTAQVHVAHGIGGHHLVRVALDEQPAVVHRQHPVDDAEQCVHDVLDPDDRDAVAGGST